MTNQNVNDFIHDLVENPSEPVIFPTDWSKTPEKYVPAEEQDRTEED